MKKVLKILKFATIFFVTPLTFSQQAVMDQDGIYLVCEKMPEIKGGLKALSKIIKYPKEAKKLGVQGVVYVQFIVDEKGVEVISEIHDKDYKSKSEETKNIENQDYKEGDEKSSEVEFEDI